MNSFCDKIKKAFADGQINEFMYRKLMSASENGITEDLCDDMVGDAQYASDIGVTDDRGYNIYFFVMRCADDLMDDTFGKKLDGGDKQDLCRYILSHKDSEEYNLNDLLDHRLLIYKWLCDRLSKKAHPNIAGRDERGITFDIKKWIDTLKKIYGAVQNNGAVKSDAVNYFTNSWDIDERYKFISWMKYYEGGNTERYNVKTANFIKMAFGQDVSLPQSWMNANERQEDVALTTYRQKREQTKRERELEQAKQYKFQMRSRLRSFKKLLERYHDILTKQNLDHIYDEIYRLEKSVSGLDVFASISDCVARSALRLEKLGFPEGAALLVEAAPGKETADVLQAIPPASSHVDMKSDKTMADVGTIINRLENISKTLKSRDIIRELASIDILLNELGMAAFFPEISDSQSKLIESFGYASNKVDPVLAKLRGGGAAAKPLAPEMNVPQSPAPKMPAAAPIPVQKEVKKPLSADSLVAEPIKQVQKKLPT